MNAARTVLPLFILLFLAACAPRVPEPFLTEVPPGPLLQALEQRSRAFLSLRATASAQAFRKGRRLGLDNVGVLIRSRERLRIDAYGPLGQPVLEVAWNGSEVQLRRYGEPVALGPGAGWERYLGADIGPGELCAVLTGNVPLPAAASGARARCGGNACVLELEQGDLVRRIHLAPTGAGADVRPEVYELSRSGVLLFRARFEQWVTAADYAVPRKVVLENPERKAGLTLLYEDIELNCALDEGAFTLSDRKEP